MPIIFHMTPCEPVANMGAEVKEENRQKGTVINEYKIIEYKYKDIT